MSAEPFDWNTGKMTDAEVMSVDRKWIDGARARGTNVSLGKKRTNVSLPIEVFGVVSDLAATSGRSFSSMAAYLICIALKKWDDVEALNLQDRADKIKAARNVHDKSVAGIDT